MTGTPPPGLRVVGRRLRLARFVVFVLNPDATETRVRVDYRRAGRRYRCDDHGDQPAPACVHALAAAQLTNHRRERP